MRTRFFVLLLAASSAALAYEPERARTNFSHEAAECSAYFMFVSTAPALDDKTVKGLRGKFETLLQIAVALSSEKLAKARFELAVETMKREMEGNWSNLSIVNNKYGYQCIDLANSPEARLQYWIDKKD